MFEVLGLFAKYDYKIAFPTATEHEDTASLIILYGLNGVGKTTLLAMISGLVQLDFDPFRAVPFKSARLTFSDNSFISVVPQTTKLKDKEKIVLKVTFDDNIVELHIRAKGSFDVQLQTLVDEFRERYFEHIKDVSVDFISIDRLRSNAKEIRQQQTTHMIAQERPASRDEIVQPYINVPRFAQPEPHYDRSISRRIKRFMSEAQLEHGRFFSIGQPDLFTKIIERVTHPRGEEFPAAELLQRLEGIRKSDEIADRFQLSRERWDYPQLRDILSQPKRSKSKQHVLPIIGSYVEVLESRAQERDLLAQRLSTFEEVVNDFLLDKKIQVDVREGLTIYTENQSKLNELQLSSGEYHLLYLLSSAMTTRRRGTVIAVDEPEMSMHIAWQRKLLPAMLRCASMAQPQLIVATHSPEIAGSYPDQCLNLGV
ncbi:MAG: AAA family ATPase [Deltaproteobacteria bacterium]|nr:AAA family ATPase [Deltaproteobacteria bacterium]